MNGSRSWLDRMSEGLDLPGETPPGLPIIEIAGDNRVLIENHCGIIQYGCDQIGIKVKYGVVKVCGNDLELARMSCNQLVILGRIDSVTLCRRN